MKTANKIYSRFQTFNPSIYGDADYSDAALAQPLNSVCFCPCR